jgi:hypothetical protein
LLTWLGSVGLALLTTSTDVALGKSGKGKGKGGGNSGGSGGGNSGGAKGKGAAKSKSKSRGTVLDHDAALSAVKDGKALPLGPLLPQIERKYGGEVIDAALQRTGRRLFYTLKILSPQGRVFVIVVDAATGQPDNDVEFFGL